MKIIHSLAIVLILALFVVPISSFAEKKSANSHQSASSHVIKSIKAKLGALKSLTTGARSSGAAQKMDGECVDPNAEGERYCNFVFDESDIGTTTYTYAFDIPATEGAGTIDLAIDIYAPENDSETLRPLVLFAHGGGGTKDDNAITLWCTERFAMRGYVCGSIDYRGASDVQGEFTAELQTIALSDMQAAVRWARENSTTLGIDPNKIILMGSSAGGITAIQAGVMGNNQDADMFLEPKANTTHPDELSWSCAAVTLSGAINPQIDNYLDANDPAAFMYHGEEDPKIFFSEAVASKEKMNSFGIPTTLLSFPNTGHNLGGHTDEIVTDLFPKLYTQIVTEGCPPAHTNLAPISSTTTDPIETPTEPSSGGGGGSSGNNDGNVLGTETAKNSEDSAPTCPYLRDRVYIGAGNNPDEVRKLETFLRDHEQESVTIDGIFGVSDIEAVKRFQTKYAGRIPTLPGINLPVGNVGWLTQNQINILSCLPAVITSCPVFTEYNATYRNSNSNEVTQAKSVLRALGFYNGLATPIFDTEFEQALTGFQKTFHSYILDPGGFAPGTKSQLTNKFLNTILGCDTAPVFVGWKMFDY